jgi:alcohol dehydrogenase class IV
LKGIHLIVEALPRACRDGNDIDARGKMLVAAAMGAVAFQKDLGVVHSLAHPLSTICGMHHGPGLMPLLPHTEHEVSVRNGSPVFTGASALPLV